MLRQEIDPRAGRSVREEARSAFAELDALITDPDAAAVLTALRGAGLLLEELAHLRREAASGGASVGGGGCGCN